jgi:hypothetical protein
MSFRWLNAAKTVCCGQPGKTADFFPVDPLFTRQSGAVVAPKANKPAKKTVSFAKMIHLAVCIKINNCHPGARSKKPCQPNIEIDVNAPNGPEYPSLATARGKPQGEQFPSPIDQGFGRDGCGLRIASLRFSR